MGKTDPIKRAYELRPTLKQGNEVLVVKFEDTLQGKDTSRVIDLMPNVKTGEKVFRAKVNVKELDPIASQVYGKQFVDIRTMSDAEIEAYINTREFDFPLWFKHNTGFSIRNVLDYNPPFIMQIGGCNFHDGSDRGGCWYCFVDDDSNNGKIVGKTLLAPEDHVESMVQARQKVKELYKPEGFDINMRVVRNSGGEPTLTLDYILAQWREIARRGLDFVGQIDSNLSTGSVVDSFEESGVYEKHTLEKLAEFPVKILTAIKGVDNENLLANIQSTATIETQVHSIEKFLRAGFDIYPQAYNPNPAKLAAYLEMMEGRIENFALRVHIGPLSLYGPNKKRLTIEAKVRGIDPETHIAAKKAEWDANYRAGVEVMESYLRQKHGVGYKQVTRSDAPLKLLNAA